VGGVGGFGEVGGRGVGRFGRCPEFNRKLVILSET